MRPFLMTAFLDPRFQKIRYRLAILLYLMVLALGSIPDARAEMGTFASGLVLHSLTYAALTVLLFTGSQGGAVNRAVKSMLTIMAMGAIDEFVQSFLPYRTAAFSDWLVDCIAGVVASTLLWALWPNTAGTPEAKKHCCASPEI